jgi:hypothetical protein
MNEHLVSKIINLCVVKLSNSWAIACVPRLDLDYFESQADSPRLNQRLLKPVIAGAIDVSG